MHHHQLRPKHREPFDGLMLEMPEALRLAAVACAQGLMRQVAGIDWLKA